MRIDYTKRFLKQFKASPKNIQIAFRNRLALYIKEPNDPILRKHQLKGELIDYLSINITGDWRALYREISNGSGVVFEMIGTHSQLYK